MSRPLEEKTAGIIIIGNEILSGKVQDANSFYLASELRELGVSVMRISVIPDDIEVIGRETSCFAGSFDFVFTSGGVGPTHDDITMAGIAKGFDVRLVPHPLLTERFRERYGSSLNEAVLKMAEVPEGAEVIPAGNGSFPLVAFRNIFIFPGIPEYLRKKFSLLKERFRSSAFHLSKIYLNTEESNIAAILNQIVRRHADVAIGSYPVLHNPEYKIIVTAESRSEEQLKFAVAEIVEMMPDKVVVRIN